MSFLSGLIEESRKSLQKDEKWVARGDLSKQEAEKLLASEKKREKKLREKEEERKDEADEFELDEEKNE